MAALMRALLIGLVVLVIASCHGEGENEESLSESKGNPLPQPNKQASVEGLALTLDVVDGHCRLAYDDAGTVRHMPLALPPPCRFKRGDGPEVRTEKYSSDGYTATVLIVIGGVAEPDPLVPTMQTDCGNRMQGVLVSNRIPIPSSLVNLGVACASTSVDEKVYRIIYDDEKDRLPFQLNEQALVDGLALTLDVVDGHCRLTYDDAGTVRHVPLDLPPPCRFVRDGGPEVRTEKYTSSSYVVTVLIVIGGTAEQDSWMPATLRVDCGSHVQGVLISDGKAVPTSRVGRGVVVCAGVGLDQKEYRIFHDDEKDRLPY